MNIEFPFEQSRALDEIGTIILESEWAVGTTFYAFALLRTLIVEKGEPLRHGYCLRHVLLKTWLSEKLAAFKRDFAADGSPYEQFFICVALRHGGKAATEEQLQQIAHSL